ncbi:hypothetical protein P3S68_003391 [Capsicum galapagoense]
MEKAFTSFLFMLQYYVISSSAMTQFNISTDQLALLSLKSKIISDPFHLLDESRSPPSLFVIGLESLVALVTRELGNHVNLSQEMTHLHRLKFLDLSFNSFSGEVPSWFEFLHQLQVLNLGNNSFTGSIPSSFSNISTLETSILKFNSIEGQISKVIGSLINLTVLNLGGNKLIGFIPMLLSNASRLETLEISYNSLQGNIPEGIGYLHNMKVLSIQENQLTDSIPFPVFIISRIEVIALSNNSLSGYLPNGLCNGIIPQEIGNLVNLMELWMESNQMTGSVPISIFNISVLKVLSLAGNNLNGFLSHKIGILTKMQFLYHTQNRFTGEIPKEIINLVELEELLLGSNRFRGPLTMVIFNISGLRVIYLSFNNLSGRLPPNLGSLLPNIEELYLSDINNLVGTIPHSISNCSKLTILDLSYNKLTGFIGDHICKLHHLGDIYLGQNQLSGSLPNCLGNITSLREIHLGSNKLSSNIPPSLGNLQDLVVLDLSSTRVSNMVGLEFLNFSNDNISGIIPMSLEKLQNLKYFNVFVNKLYGEIPSGGPFKNLLSQFFVYNEALCGSSRFSVPPCPTSSKHRISYYELIQATDVLSESNLIGSESFGSLYKRVLKSGTAIAVKVFNMQVDEAFKILDMECEVLRNLRHRNLGKVITSCSNLDFKALVLEYMPNGRLDKYLYLHYFLDIKQRLSIMIDVAYAVEYLHSGCSSPVIHCDLNPSNV